MKMKTNQLLVLLNFVFIISIYFFMPPYLITLSDTPLCFRKRTNPKSNLIIRINYDNIMSGNARSVKAEVLKETDKNTKQLLQNFESSNKKSVFNYHHIEGGTLIVCLQSNVSIKTQVLIEEESDIPDNLMKLKELKGVEKTIFDAGSHLGNINRSQKSLRKSMKAKMKVNL